jgi:hypothetical protein
MSDSGSTQSQHQGEAPLFDNSQSAESEERRLYESSPPLELLSEQNLNIESYLTTSSEQSGSSDLLEVGSRFAQEPNYALSRWLDENDGPPYFSSVILSP